MFDDHRIDLKKRYPRPPEKAKPALPAKDVRLIRYYEGIDQSDGVAYIAAAYVEEGTARRPGVDAFTACFIVAVVVFVVWQRWKKRKPSKKIDNRC